MAVCSIVKAAGKRVRFNIWQRKPSTTSSPSMLDDFEISVDEVFSGPRLKTISVATIAPDLANAWNTQGRGKMRTKPRPVLAMLLD